VTLQKQHSDDQVIVWVWPITNRVRLQRMIIDTYCRLLSLTTRTQTGLVMLCGCCSCCWRRILTVHCHKTPILTSALIHSFTRHHTVMPSYQIKSRWMQSLVCAMPWRHLLYATSRYQNKITGTLIYWLTSSRTLDFSTEATCYCNVNLSRAYPCKSAYARPTVVICYPTALSRTLQRTLMCAHQ